MGQLELKVVSGVAGTAVGGPDCDSSDVDIQYGFRVTQLGLRHGL